MRAPLNQKISIPYHGRLLGFPKGRRGSRLWNSEGIGGGGGGGNAFWNFRRLGGGGLKLGSCPWLGMDIFWNCPF